MACFVQLLGVPRLLRADGSPVLLRGRKAWAVLAYLAIEPTGVGRQHLARLLFEEADDPLAALRWNLAELRRALGAGLFRGDTLGLDRSAIAGLDVDVLRRGACDEAVRLPGLGRELLEGLDLGGSPAFAVWLMAERRHMQATSQSVLHEAALARLAVAKFDEAVGLASRLVALDALDEGAQVLLVRCLAASGDGVRAARQAAACRELFRRELGVAPSPALSDALRTSTAEAVSLPAAGRAGVLAQLEAGEAAIGAGVLEPGLQCLRRAVGDADRLGDPELRARCRVALGGALVHAARGRDAEGAAALHEALAIGEATAARQAAAACRELGYVEFLLGRYERAQAWLDRAEPLVPGDRAEQARRATLRGTILSDTARYVPAMAWLQQALDGAVSVRDLRQQIYAESMVGRVHLLIGQPEEAIASLDGCIAQAQALWTAFLPWPLSLRGEVDLQRGDVGAASDRFEHAFALGCQLSDPCWEGVAGRGRGLVAAARGDAAAAVALLTDALARCVRLPDAYAWARAHVLDGLCSVAIDCHHPQAAAWVEQLLSLATRSGMRALALQAQRHRARLGVPGADAAGRIFAAE